MLTIRTTTSLKLRKELQEYLELYINFKLKVKQGYEEGIDTSETFLKELASYRSQSAQ